VPWLQINIDLSEVPENGEPNEVAVMLRELADWIEKRPDPFAPMKKAKILRNFESTPCGRVTLY
jgi:hypothetical protein